ncbi:MAG: DUF4189 domain-containing protein, partial [Candidatus Hydrogenedentes bacterium]|nr:DUF4189 domain-containing protein [Candidatus Hydrogenedentota bacterium]
VGVCCAFVCVEVWAAAAIAYDNDTGVLGYGIGLDKASAKAAALADCTNNGATQPVFWFWYAHEGWGATYYSDNGGGDWAIGGALGYDTKKKAKRKAKRECENGGGTNCQLVDVFKDTTGTKSGRGKRMRLHS